MGEERFVVFEIRGFPPLAANCKIVNGAVAVGVGSGYEGQFPEPNPSDMEIMFLELVAYDRRNHKFPGHSQAGAG